MLARLQRNISLSKIILTGNPVESGVTRALHQRFMDLEQQSVLKDDNHHLVDEKAYTEMYSDVKLEGRKAEKSHNHRGPMTAKLPGGMREEVAQHRVRSSAALLQAKRAVVLLESSNSKLNMEDEDDAHLIDESFNRVGS